MLGENGPNLRTSLRRHAETVVRHATFARSRSGGGAGVAIAILLFMLLIVLIALSGLGWVRALVP